jgi:hypothetical protein
VTDDQFTLKEILLRIEAKLDSHLENGHANTPTRAEVFGVLIAIGGVFLAAS